MRILKPFLLSLFVIALTTSCKKEEPDVQSPASKLRGKVVLLSEYGDVEIHGRAGTHAALTGPFQGHNATTDNSGRFEFANIADNTYSLTVSREGYTPVTMSGIQFSQNSPNYPVSGDYQQLPTITLAQKSVSHFDSTMVSGIYDVLVTHDTIDDIPYTYIDTLSADLYFRSLRVGPESFNPAAKFGYRMFLGKTAAVGPNNYLKTYHGITSGSQIEIEKLWTQAEWQEIGLDFDEPIFIKIFGDAVQPITYTTPNNQVVFPNLSDSIGVDSTQIISFQQ